MSGGPDMTWRALMTEVRQLGRLGGPVLISQLAYMAAAAADSVMAGRLGVLSLAAVGLGAALWVPVTTFIGGVLYVLLPRVAGHQAARRDGRAGKEAIQAAWLGAALGLIGAALLLVAAPRAFPLLSLSPDLAVTTMAYLTPLAVGLPFVGVWMAMRYFCDGHGDTKPAMITAIGVAAVNILLNLVLMFEAPFGAGTGFGLGVAGTGVATAISMVCGAVALTAWSGGAARYRPAWRGAGIPVPATAAVWDMLRKGLPIGLGLLVEYSIMTTIAVLVGREGPSALAAHQIAFNISVTLFMVPVAISIAISIRVGAALGRGDAAGERRALMAGCFLATILAAVAALAILGAADQVVALYSGAPVVAALAAALLVPAAAFQVVDALQVAIAGALRGRGDVTVPLLMMFGAYWLVGIPLGWSLSARFGVLGWWYALVAAITVVAVLFGVRAAAVTSGPHASSEPSAPGP